MPHMGRRVLQHGKSRARREIDAEYPFLLHLSFQEQRTRGVVRTIDLADSIDAARTMA